MTVAAAKAFSAELTILQIVEVLPSIYFSKEPAEIDLHAIGEMLEVRQRNRLQMRHPCRSEGVKTKQKVIS